MTDEISKINLNLKAKLEKLIDNKFSDDDCFEFFGNLNQAEIESLLALIKNNSIDLPDEAKNFLTIYLDKLRQVIMAKKQN